MMKGNSLKKSVNKQKKLGAKNIKAKQKRDLAKNRAATKAMTKRVKSSGMSKSFSKPIVKANKVSGRATRKSIKKK